MSPTIEGLPLWIASTNAWVVAPDGPGGECVLIDAPPNPYVIVNHLRSRQLKLVAVFLTHGHADHLGGTAEVVRAHGHEIPVRIHEGDHEMLVDPVRRAGELGKLLEMEGLDVRPPEIVHGLDDGEAVGGAGMFFTAIHTPGHTPGSTCFLLHVEGEQPVLFSGDHLFAGSIGRTDLPGGSYDQLMESMVEKILPLDDQIEVLPGHGKTTTIGDERRTNPFLLEMTGKGQNR